MSGILDKILARKREEVAELKSRLSPDELRKRAATAPDQPSLVEAIARPGAPHLIAEVKKASPSKGLIRADFDPVAIARAYEAGGAAALSVLTDRDFFQGSLEYLTAICREVTLPILRKDFIIDAIQILEARAAGASAVLLIAAALDPEELAALHAETDRCGLDALVEVHDENDLDRVARSGIVPRLIGVNNRNLRTFEVDLGVTERLAPRLPEGSLLVGESGIFTPADVARLARVGASAILVGESLMRQPDVARATRELLASSGESPSGG